MVMLSQPDPSPLVSGAKQASSNCKTKTPKAFVTLRLLFRVVRKWREKAGAHPGPLTQVSGSSASAVFCHNHTVRVLSGSPSTTTS